MTAQTRFQTARGPIELGDRPLIVGVLNVTPDSFSDGGAYLDPGAAADRAFRMAAEGAAVIDIGGLSTRPGSKPVDLETEAARLIPVLERLAGRLPTPISIDTYRAEVFRRALDHGAAILNDVSALRADPAMAGLAARSGAGVVLMHMAGVPETMQVEPRYGDVVAEVRDFLAAAVGRAQAAGIGLDRIAVDPGIGFGKTVDHNLLLLARLEAFAVLGLPLFVGCSRKSFLGKILDRADPSEREYATAATTARSYAAGARFVRVHDVRATADVITLLDRIRTAGTGACS